MAAIYLAYMLICADAPKLFARPLSGWTVAPLGLIGGVVVVAVVVVTAWIYVVIKAGRDGTEP